MHRLYHLHVIHVQMQQQMPVQYAATDVYAICKVQPLGNHPVHTLTKDLAPQPLQA